MVHLFEQNRSRIRQKLSAHLVELIQNKLPETGLVVEPEALLDPADHRTLNWSYSVQLKVLNDPNQVLKTEHMDLERYQVQLVVLSQLATLDCDEVAVSRAQQYLLSLRLL